MNAIKKSFKNFLYLSPMILAIIGLIGIFKAFITPQIISSLFIKNAFYDTFIGLISGAIAVGQAIISYILGGELLKDGVSMYGVSAFILAWVTLGIVQLPLEASVLGIKFTILRNTLAVIFTFIISIATVWTIGFIG